MALDTEIAGERMTLLAERGLFWHRRAMLLVADWHLGKAAAFRAAGIGVPDGGLEEELGRLDSMLANTRAEHLMLLGDLVHARPGLTDEIAGRFRDWIATCGVQVSLVDGNHDRSAGIDRVGRLGIRLLGGTVRHAPFVLQHEPGPSRAGYVLAGHWHPALRLGEGKRGGVSAPCFWFGRHYGVLPAFGGFTGGRRIGREAGDRMFAIGAGEVIEIPA